MIFHKTEGAGEPVVLIHGVGGDLASWDAVAPVLAKRFRVIRLDLSGHGKSHLLKGPVTAEDFAREVLGVMDERKVEAAYVAGNSLGGQIVTAMALGSPQRVKRMALISSVAGRTEQERTSALARIEVLKEKGIGEIARGNIERWFTDEFRRKHPELVEARIRTLMQSDPPSYLRAFTVFATADYADRFAEIRVPTLIVTGEHDPSATPRMARLMHERIAGSRVEILPGLRHSLLIEAPEKISALLAEFFA
jgi:3-oxoadipate enol-lactonase